MFPILNCDKYTVRQILLGFAVTLDVFLFGSGLSFSATLLTQLEAPESTITITESDRTWIASLSSFGSIPGTFLGALTVELLGRKWNYTMIAFSNACSWCLIASSTQAWHLLLGRLMQGFVAGLGFSVSYCFMAEVVSLQYRSILLNVINIGTSMGQLYVSIMGTYYSFRLSAYILTGTSLVCMIVFLYLRNTHVWYLQREQLTKAKTAYFWYRNQEESTMNDFNAQVENLKEIRITFNRLRKELMSREFLKPLGILVWFFTTIMTTGALGINLYSVELMRQIVSIDEYLTNTIIGVLRVASTIVIIFLLRISPMRKLVIAGSIGITASLIVIILGLYFEGYWNGCEVVVVVAIFTFNLIFNLCYLNMIVIYIGEIFTGTSKPTGTAMIAAYFNLIVFASGSLIPLMFNSLGNVKTFTIFCLSNAIASVVLYFILPETKNVSSEEIRNKFRKRSKSSNQKTGGISMIFKE